MPSIIVNATGLTSTGALGPINNAESVIGGFRSLGLLGIQYYTQALRAPAASGHVLAGSTTTDIVIDTAVDLLDCVCEPHKLTVVLPDGSIESRYILAACGTSGGGSVLTVEVPFSLAPAQHAPWILTDGVEVGDGHVVSGTVSSVTLDSSVELDICGSYTLTVFKPDGTGVEAQDTLTDCGEHTTVTLEQDLAVAPDPGWIWTLRDAPDGWMDVTVTLAGAQCAGVLGGAQVSIPPSVVVFGIGMVSALGTVTVSIGISATPTGVSATGAVGVPGYRQDQLRAVTGLSSVSTLGSVSVQIAQLVSVIGRSANGQVGTVAINVHMNVPVTGVSATGQIGVVVVGTQGQFPVFGQFASANLGTVAVKLDPNVAATGVQSATALGTASVDTASNGEPAVSGLASTGTHGAVAVTTDVDVIAVGVESQGTAGSLNTGQLQIAEPRGVHAVGMLGAVQARATTERQRVLHVPTGKTRALRVSTSTDGLPLAR